MSLAVVVDTNVVVAGLLTSTPTSPVARILDGMLAATLPFVVSQALIAEYRDVLNRPRLHKAHGLETAQVELLVAALVKHAIVLKPGTGPAAPDPGDQHLWDLLAARKDLVLVTGDKLLQGPGGTTSHVMDPAAFVARWLD